MPWDPLGAWAKEARWIWLTAAGWLSLVLGPAFLKTLQTTPETIPDFFQEYASARNWREGLPIYTPHGVTIPRYLDARSGKTTWSFTTLTRLRPSCWRFPS